MTNLSQPRVFAPHRLRTAMATAGVSPKELSEQIHRSTGTINAYLVGRTVPSVDIASRMAHAIGVTLDDLLTEAA